MPAAKPVKHGFDCDAVPILVHDEPIRYFQHAVGTLVGVTIQMVPFEPPLQLTLVVLAVVWNTVQLQQQFTGLTLVTIELEVPETDPHKFKPDGPPRLNTLTSIVCVPAHKYFLNVKLWNVVKFVVLPCNATGVIVEGMVTSIPSI